MLDTVRAAREALATAHLSRPRRRGDRAALRVLLATRQSAVLTAPPRSTSAPGELRGMKSKDLVDPCAKLRDRPAQNSEHCMTVRALRSAGQRIEALRSEAKKFELELPALVRTIAPELIALQGIGPISAAQILISWSHGGRFRSEAAFAGVIAPIPAQSGLTDRHRINRRRRPAAQPGTPYDHVDPHPSRSDHPRPPNQRGKDRERRPTLPQARHLPTAPQMR
ncbi:transposase [Streptomyces sp. 3211]|uniref:transposase n=1 Tax=Streptomyces sp. 3211 TaxID=1964449 RepID=UPI001844B970|nr:transposase [Streptomyces sp. 3211]